MEKLSKYKSIVRDLIMEYGSLASESTGVTNSIVADDQRGQYMLVTSGWENDSRIYGPYLHLEVRNGKVYVHHNGTDIHVAHELAEKGIPKEDIVLEFQAPYKRKHTGFAIA